MISAIQKLLRSILGIKECYTCGVIAVRSDMGCLVGEGFSGNLCTRCKDDDFVYYEYQKSKKSAKWKESLAEQKKEKEISWI